jgi:glycosyltransferase involved in cell wall biosynthesis
MLGNRRVVVVMPAWNAAATLRRTVSEIDMNVIDEIVLVDDASTDTTIAEARRLGLPIELHQRNRGYGGAQKTCYTKALEHDAEVVVMVHPDYQYSPRLVPAMAAMIAYGEYDFVLGSRILAQNAIEGGMPRYKYVANRALTFVENLMVGSKLSEFHTGLRAYSRELLEAIPYELNSEDFVFDNQVIVQALAAGARIGEVSCPTRYEAESSSINFSRSVKYGLGVLSTAFQYRRYARGRATYPYLDIKQKLEHTRTDDAGDAVGLAVELDVRVDVRVDVPVDVPVDAAVDVPVDMGVDVAVDVEQGAGQADSTTGPPRHHARASRPAHLHQR